MESVRGTRRGAAATAVALLMAAGCGGEDGSPDGAADSSDSTTTVVASTTEAPVVEEDLQILVTNDDGVGAEGIDTLVVALEGVGGVEVTVVAPAAQQSGTGGKVTEGPLTSTPVKTVGGHEATAVDGFPSDTVRVAIDELGLEPDLVIAGINEGQNVGPLVEISGTVGAARAAARRGVPAVAVSQGLGRPFDYEQAAELVVRWLEEHRDALAAGEQTADVVVNLNVPSCDTGELRGTVEVAVATDLDAFTPTSDCTSTAEGFADDVAALANGFATITELSLEPAATQEG